MKSVKAVNMKEYEYRQERNAIKKETKSLRSQRKNRKGQWTNIVGYD